MKFPFTLSRRNREERKIGRICPSTLLKRSFPRRLVRFGFGDSRWKALNRATNPRGTVSAILSPRREPQVTYPCSNSLHHDPVRTKRTLLNPVGAYHPAWPAGALVASVCFCPFYTRHYLLPMASPARVWPQPSAAHDARQGPSLVPLPQPIRPSRPHPI
jgi:hypothetical protein